MNINTSIILPGGWHIQCNGYRIPHKSELPSPQAVIEALMHYRLENNIEVGNPEADLEEYVCTHFPTWCRREGAQPRPIQESPGRRNVDLVIQWANVFYTQVGRLQLIPQREAEQRATICKNCPLQMNWEHDCPPCVTSAQRLLQILRQGKDIAVAQEANAVRGCSLYGWDNRTACHIDKQHLPQPQPWSPSELLDERMKPEALEQYWIFRRNGVTPIRALRLAKGLPEYTEEELKARRGRIKAIYDGVPPYDPEELQKAAAKMHPCLDNFNSPWRELYRKLLYDYPAVIHKRPGTKFLVEIPKGYEALFHQQADGVYIVAKHTQGMEPILYLHREDESYFWRDHMPIQAMRLIVEEEK